MKTTPPLLFLMAFAFAALMLSNCKKDKKDVPTPNSTTTTPTSLHGITADTNTAYQYQIFTLTADSNITFQQSRYTATLDTAHFNITIVGGHTLVFQVPGIAPGTYTLHSIVDGAELTTTVIVLALAPIADPNAYIQNALTNFEYTASYLTNIANQTSTTYGASNDAANINVLNSYRTTLNDSLANATPEQKMKLAQFMAANPVLFQPLEDLMPYIDSLTFKSTTMNPEVAWNIFRLRVKLKIADLATAGAIAFAANGIAAGLPAFAIIALGANVAVAYKLFELGKFLIAEAKSYIQSGDLSTDNVYRNINYEFNTGQQYTFVINSDYRNINQQDVGSSSAAISEVLSYLTNFKNTWNTILGFLPTSLVGAPYEISNIAPLTKNRPVKGTYLTIQNISNPNVTVSVVNTGTNLKATFSTTQTTDQTFSFDIHYENPGVSSSDTHFTGKVIHPNPCDGSLSATLSRSGVNVTATVTGGTAPYQYEFSNGYAHQSVFSSSNTYNLIYDGKYTVIVKDANGCLDTTYDCVNDVVITNFSAYAFDTINTYPNGIIKLEYTSSLGLVPKFTAHSGTNYTIAPIYTGGNSSSYPPDISQWCNGQYPSSLATTYYGTGGTNYSRSIYWIIQNDNAHTLGTSIVSVRFFDYCFGTAICPSGSPMNTLFSPEYTFTW